MKRLIYILITLSLTFCVMLPVAGKQRSSSTVKKEQKENQEQINKTQRQIADNEQQTRRKLNHLNSLQGEILKQNNDIRHIEMAIDSFHTAITNVEDTIVLIENNIAKLKEGYARSLRQKRANRKTINTFAFVFSSPTFMQAFKRVGYMQQAEKWRQAKAAELAEQKELLKIKRIGLGELHESLSAKLAELGVAKSVLEKKQESTAQAVTALKAEGESLQKVLAQRRKKAQNLQRELDRIIAEETRKAEEERRKEEARKAEEKRKAEAARKAEEARKTEEERKAKEAANAGANKGNGSGSSSSSSTASSSSTSSTANSSSSSAASSSSSTKTASASAALSGSFKDNKGKIMFPVAGKYNIVGQFGRTQHNQLTNIEVENAGIDIEVPQGTQARAVFDGTVSSIFFLDGYHNIVILRHGDYLTVYAGIESLSVKKGQIVKAGSNLGKIHNDADDDNRSLLHFEVRHEKEKLNPMEWLR